jgi:sugar lactone lactonase YvrE
VTLNAPKGLAIRGDSLFVADIDSERIFGRESGQPLGAWGVPGATFLNDLATAPDGTLYVTDTGFKAGASGFEPTGADALYRFEALKPVKVAGGSDLGAPNGVASDGQRLFVVTFGSGKVFRVAGNGSLDEIPQAGLGQMDGIVILDDGSLAISSWAKGAVFRYWTEGDRQGQLVQLGAPLESPADIGYDAARKRILVPSFNANRLESRSLEP